MLTMQDLEAIRQIVDERAVLTETRLEEKIEQKLDLRFKEYDEKLDLRFEKYDKKFKEYDEKLDLRFKEYDEKLDLRFTESEERLASRLERRINERAIETEELLLGEIDRYYNLNKDRIASLRADVTAIRKDVDILMSRSNVLDIYQITNNHERRITCLERRML